MTDSARTASALEHFTLTSTPVGSAPEQALEVEQWFPAIVPGGVHESLLEAGAIPHPYLGQHEDDIRWIEDRDWWYRARFSAPTDLEPDERLRLVFHGLDTVVDIHLNGALLGSHENMFRPAEFDVTDLVQAENDLLLRFSPPLAGLEVPPSVAEMGQRLAKVFASLAGDENPAGEGEGFGAMLPLSTLRRKATFSWGWDFGPRVPSIGIWRPVELVREHRAAIIGHHIRTDAIAGDAAHLRLLVEVDTFQPSTARLTARVALTSPTGARFETVLPVENGAACGSATIEQAVLWWTHDLGDPALYDVQIELLDGDALLDVRRDRVGLRTIEIDREKDPDEEGQRFRFVLNGQPIFARGAAWLPASMMVGSVSAERQHELIRLARDGNMNMLRIWGGGVYEHDAFYRATDELGVLVWHDFMFACTDYPSLDPVLQREVALEAEYQVKRLRNRASMALWAGNNEVQLIHGFAYQDYAPGDWGWDFFHRILPEAVQQFDGGVPYWPGSPWGEDLGEGFMAVNGVLDGDRHAWEVWHGFDFGAGGGPYESVGEARHYRRYANDTGKFISEFGIHASPVLDTLQRWIPDDLAVHSAGFDAHNKDHPKNKGDALLEIITGVPETVEEYVDATMVSQAEGLKFGVEHYRRRQPHCSGTLVWQFNDVWPGFSWSVIDHDTVPKAGYYAIRRAFSPVVASFSATDDTVTLWITNSGRTAVETEAVVTVRRFDGGVEVEQRVHVALAAGDSAPAWTWSSADGLTADRFAWVESADGLFPANRLFFGEIKDLPLVPPRLETAVERTGTGSMRVSIRSTGYSYLTRVTTKHSAARFSENYFDLRDGQSRVIEVTGLPASATPEDLQIGSYAGPR